MSVDPDPGVKKHQIRNNASETHYYETKKKGKTEEG